METDAAILTVRPYTADDYPLVNDWWQARHGALVDLPAAMLPPLGVIVEDADGPAFALWCYESFGVGVAFIEWPVSRPGLCLPRARALSAKAVESVIALAGKQCDPPGEYKVFRAIPGVSLFRAMGDLGFRRESEYEQIPVILNLND
jgi:hypothetical protein